MAGETREAIFLKSDGEPQELFSARDEKVDYVVLDSEGNPKDITSDSIAIKAVLTPDDTGQSPTTLTYTTVIAPVQTLGAVTRGRFQLIMPAAEHPAGPGAPGDIVCDVIFNGKTRVLWEARLVISDAG